MSLPDAQFSLAEILRPYDDFEDVYQGQDARRGVPFFAPDSNNRVNPRDPDAGEPGFDPDLLNYVNVPLGSEIMVWVPAVFFVQGVTFTQTTYRYRFHWRMRNVTDFRNRRTPYHIKRQFPGTPDTTTPTNQQRLLIPAATRSVLVNQLEVADNLTQVQNARREAIDYRSDVDPGAEYGINARILLPGGAVGVHQQGLFDPQDFDPDDQSAPTQPIYMVERLVCEGDQLLISAGRDLEPGATWDFAGVDAPFSAVYGRNEGGTVREPLDAAGIYLFTGTKA